MFHNHLPHLRWIRNWLQAVDGSPGITVQALAAVENKAKEYNANGKQLLIALMADEMHIKKKIEWDDSQRKFSGFVTCRDDVSGEKQKDQGLPVASNALVFMAVGDDFKVPVAYFLLTGLNSLARAALTQLVIKRINETSARVISLTQVIISNNTILLNCMKSKL